MNTARAGWAETDITPPLGLPMGGRGPRFAPGTSILSPLKAQACVLQDSQGRMTCWISCDLIGLARTVTQPLRFEIAAQTGVAHEAIVLNFAHTHSGPMTGFDDYATDALKPAELQVYEDEVRSKIQRLACDAVARLQPATVTLHRGASQVGINRRRRNAEGQMMLAPNPEGLYNPDLWVFDVAAGSGERCILFNYGCHAVIAYGFAWQGISSDYPGMCRDKLGEALGKGVQCQFIQGLAGNVRPRVLADLEQGRFRSSTPADLESAGAQLAQDVLEALSYPGEKLALDLRAASGWFQARRDVSKVQPLAHWQALAQSDDELSRNLGRYWSGRLQAGWPPVQAVPWEVGLIRLTREHTIAWLAGEAVAEWQGHLRRWLQDDSLMVWGYCQAVCNYLPTDELLPEGGYEVTQSSLYGRTGPAPFSEGLNGAARARFVGLMQQIALE